MSINLQKGQRISLTKDNPNLSKVMVGLGWDPIKKSGGGFLGLGGGSVNIDCDASVIMLDSNEKFSELVYYGNLKSSNDSVKHSGDNLTGEGEGDDEQIVVDISKLPAHISKLIFVVNIYDCVNRKQDFGLIQNAFIRLVNMGNNQEISKFNLSESYSGKTALILGELYRHNTEWKFNALGEATTDISVSSMANKYK